MGRQLACLWTVRKFCGKELQPAERLRVDLMLLQEASELAPFFPGGERGVRDVAAVFVHHAFEVPALERRDRLLLQRVERAARLNGADGLVDGKPEVGGANRRRLAQKDAADDRVFEFTDVARPV